MTEDDFNEKLIRWVKHHNWDSLEKNKNLILRHLRTFIGDEVIYMKKSRKTKLKINCRCGYKGAPEVAYEVPCHIWRCPRCGEKQE